MKYDDQSHLDYYLSLPPRRQWRLPEEIEWQETDEDRSDRGTCVPHDFGICPLRQIQCKDCRLLIQGKDAWKIVAPFLQEQYGEDWTEELENMKKTKGFLGLGHYDKLELTVIDYRNEDGTIKTTRFFYRLKNTHELA